MRIESFNAYALGVFTLKENAIYIITIVILGNALY